MMHKLLAGAVATGGIALIAMADFLIGIEVRTFPLYYLPISFAAWQFGRAGAIAAAGLSALGWYWSNQLAGLQYSHALIWVANTLVQAVSFIVVGLLVARLRDALARERTLSRRDALCDLLNSRAFFEEGTRLLELCRRTRRPITLAYLDLDNFKTENDRRGHAAGDALLRRFAGRLRASIRASDIAARVGGDEFAVLLPELSADEARQAVERLHGVLTRELRDGSELVSVSVGAAIFLAMPADVESLVRAADLIMYDAKREGKGRLRVQLADPPALASPSR